MHIKYGTPKSLAGLSAQEREIISSFAADETITVTVEDLLAVSPRSRQSAYQILSRLQRKGWLQRLRRGVYSLVPLSSSSATPAIEDAWALATKLFGPAFVSGWSAAEHWDLTEQMFATVSVVTTKPQRRTDHVVGGARFQTRTLPAKRFFGSRKIWSSSNLILMADPSRMLIDILDSPRFGGGGRHTLDVAKAYWRSHHQDPDTLMKYAIRFGRGSVFKRMGFLAEAVNAKVTDDWIETCRSHLTKGLTSLDPDVPPKGPVKTRWRLRVNLPVESS